MHSHILRRSTISNGGGRKEENGDKWAQPLQRPPPIHPHFAPLRVPIGMQTYRSLSSMVVY